jgi:hypothetical protein
LTSPAISPRASPSNEALVVRLPLALAALALALALPAAEAEPPAAFADGGSGFVRGAYGKDSSSSGFDVMAAQGFNTVMTDPYRQSLDPVAAKGLKAIVWLGAWYNAPTCEFERDDATIRSQVSAIAGDPAIEAYYLGDEPRVSECPLAPAMFKQRSRLVHQLDPSGRTFTVIQAFENNVNHDYAPWAGTVDVLGFDVYPCARASSTCDFSAIDSAVTDIRRAGITSYWAVLEDFQDCYYRLPTAAELRGQFDHWAKSDMAGYLVFSWNYQSSDKTCAGTSLDLHPENIAVLKSENAQSFPPTPGPAPPGSPGGLTPGRIAAGLVAIALLGGLAVVAVAMMRRAS